MSISDREQVAGHLGDPEAAVKVAQPGHDAAAFLAAIVESSDDAIVSKSLFGVITSRNKGAERLYGHSAEEAIGRPITIVIPEDRLDEEPAILARRIDRRAEAKDLSSIVPNLTAPHSLKG